MGTIFHNLNLVHNITLLEFYEEIKIMMKSKIKAYFNFCLTSVINLKNAA